MRFFFFLYKTDTIAFRFTAVLINVTSSKTATIPGPAFPLPLSKPTSTVIPKFSLFRQSSDIRRITGMVAVGFLVVQKYTAVFYSNFRFDLPVILPAHLERRPRTLSARKKLLLRVGGAGEHNRPRCVNNTDTAWRVGRGGYRPRFERANVCTGVTRFSRKRDWSEDGAENYIQAIPCDGRGDRADKAARLLPRTSYCRRVGVDTATAVDRGRVGAPVPPRTVSARETGLQRFLSSRRRRRHVPSSIIPHNGRCVGKHLHTDVRASTAQNRRRVTQPPAPPTAKIRDEKQCSNYAVQLVKSVRRNNTGIRNKYNT